MEKRPKVAIVDDEASFRETLSSLLDDNGFEPLPFESGRELLTRLDLDTLDLALIDLKLRGESGHTLAQHVREKCDLPIVMLTGVGDETDRIVGLETSADDYITKPFNPRELIARIRAVLRRYGNTKLTDTPTADDHQAMPFGDYFLDIEQSQLVDSTGKEITLTNAEYRILEYFVTNPNRVIARHELLQALGSDLSRFMDRTIDVMILRLRRKIEKVPSKPRHLQTRRGQGYVFVTDADPGT